MRRNMDLIRQIALRIEDSDDGWAPQPLAIEGYSDIEVGYHALLMLEGGLITGDDVTSSNEPPHAIAGRLTTAGHEFIDVSRESSRWESAKALVGKAGGATFPVLMDVLTKLAVKAIGLPE